MREFLFSKPPSDRDTAKMIRSSSPLRHFLVHKWWALSGLCAIVLVAGMRLRDRSTRVATSTTTEGHTVSAVANTSPHPTDFSYDFGIVRRGDRLTHTFRIPNTTSTDWQIGDIRSSCGCTVAMVERQQVAPGEDLTVTVALLTQNRSRPTTQRVQLKRLQELAPINLVVHADIRPPLVIRPPEFVRVSRGADWNGRIQIENFDRQEWDAVTVTCRDAVGREAVGVSLSPPQPQETPREANCLQRWECDVTASAEVLSPGLHRLYFDASAQFSGAALHNGTTEARFEIVPAVAVSPPQLYIVGDGSGTARKRLLFRYGEAHDVPTSVTIDVRHAFGAVVQLDVQPPTRNIQSAVLTLSQMPSFAESSVQSQIVLSFGPPLGEEVTLPVTFVAADRGK